MKACGVCDDPSPIATVFDGEDSLCKRCAVWAIRTMIFLSFVADELSIN